MYLKMELTNSDIAIRKRINNERDDVNHHFLALLVLTQTVARQTTISEHVLMVSTGSPVSSL